MKIEKEFTLLKIDSKERLNDDEEKQTYLIVSVIDEDLNPCTFWVFKTEIVKSILKDMQEAKALSRVLIEFDLTYNGKLWNCNLTQMLFNY